MHLILFLAAAAGTKKNKVLERRILKDFQIGFVESLQQEITDGEPIKDIFTLLAKTMAKKKTQKGLEKYFLCIFRLEDIVA